MSVWHRRLSGNEDRFGIEISFVTDPDAGARTSSDMSKSWGTFRLFVDGHEPTAAIGPSGERLAGATWYLLPLLEWVTRNWDEILHVPRLPVADSGSDGAAMGLSQALRLVASGTSGSRADLQKFWTQHSIVAAREGGIFPNLVFRRIVDDIEISWDERGRPGSGRVRFLSPVGNALVKVADFVEVWQNALVAASEALAKVQPTARLERLKTDIGSIQNPTDARLSRRAALLLGLRSEPDETLGLWKQLERRGIKLPIPVQHPQYCEATLATVMFASVSPQIEATDVEILSGLQERLAVMSPDLQGLVKSEPCPLSEPWLSGYELALDVRGSLQLSDSYVSMKEVLSRLGLEVVSVQLNDDDVRGVALVRADTTLVAINENSEFAKNEWSRETTLAHELCHVLFDRNFGAQLAIVSGAWAPRRLEQRANAFAAMFRMPATGLERIVAQRQLKPAALVAAVANEYHSSYWATANHLRHLGFISNEDRDAILDQIPGSWHRA